MNLEENTANIFLLKLVKQRIYPEIYMNSLLNSEISLVAIGCDGTVVNTARVSGVIRGPELMLDRPLQWSICLLHFNELPFRRLFRLYDGQTSGPDSYTGEIGRAITSDVCLLSITKYLPICGKLKT